MRIRSTDSLLARESRGRLLASESPGSEAHLLLARAGAGADFLNLEWISTLALISNKWDIWVNKQYLKMSS